MVVVPIGFRPLRAGDGGCQEYPGSVSRYSRVNCNLQLFSSRYRVRIDRMECRFRLPLSPMTVTNPPVLEVSSNRTDRAQMDNISSDSNTMVRPCQGSGWSLRMLAMNVVLEVKMLGL